MNTAPARRSSRNAGAPGTAPKIGPPRTRGGYIGAKPPRSRLPATVKPGKV